MEYTVYTDGAYSCRHNEGAFSFVILRDDTEIDRRAGLAHNETNNRVELKAIIAGVSCVPKDATVIKVISDSMYALNTLAGVWERKKNQDLFKVWNRLKKNMPHVDIRFLFVKGHSGDYYNELCDQLCVQKLGYDPRLEALGVTDTK